MSAEPEVIIVKRYRCPFCHRSRSSRTRTVEHIGRCWVNPDAHGCKTCAFYEPADRGDPDTGYPGADESCAAGVDLAGRPQCEQCGGMGYVGDWDIGHKCRACLGSPEPVKGGPIVHCALWQPRDGAA